MNETIVNSKDTNWAQFSFTGYYAQWNTKNTGTILQYYDPSTFTWVDTGSPPSTFYARFSFSSSDAFSIRYYDSTASDYGNPIVCYQGMLLVDLNSILFYLFAHSNLSWLLIWFDLNKNRHIWQSVFQFDLIWFNCGNAN